ncbi:hypothetical protein PCANC_27951 [Puccinia coronata f. sp. avenae]|uniref:Uncharacterized protein n=1 Tax=Puccinia coronata f. sp. avenae TaxID=200324 RepID=A0A2N5TRJ0_9BASI|nr:hypothetical protein PCANC_27951 [Puccinia coronata f. sp. avenae]
MPPQAQVLATRGGLRPTCLEGEHIDLTNVDTNEKSAGNQDDDLDIEIVKSILPTGKTINTYQPPQRSKRPSNQSPLADHPAPKKQRTTNTKAKQQPRKFPAASSTTTGRTPLASGSRPCPQKSGSASQTPITPGSGQTSKPCSKDSPQEIYRLKYNTLASAMVALRQIVAALQLLKGRKEMTAKATPAKLADFVCDPHTLVKMMQGLPSGLECSPLPELAWASASDSPKEENDDSQKLTMVVEGWEYCKLTWDLLNDPRAKHKATFCADLSRVFLDLFREQCYAIWNAVEEACPSLDLEFLSCVGHHPDFISGVGGSSVCNLRRARLP